MSCVNNVTSNNAQQMEDYIKAKAQIEDQIDYQFIQRLVQELTQSCALPLPVPAAAMPNLILQAAGFFWQNDDAASEERWYCLANSNMQRYGGNNIVKLPPQIIAVSGVFKTSDSFNIGVMGDFSIERIIMNNSALASNLGGSMASVFGNGGGYSLMDVAGGLYEISTYKAMLQAPLTYEYNMFSNTLDVLGALGSSNLVLDTWKRCKIQDLYKNYYFFRYCVALGWRSMATILGTFEYKLPGGISLNYSRFDEKAEAEMEKIEEILNKNHSPSYIYTSNSI